MKSIVILCVIFTSTIIINCKTDQELSDQNQESSPSNDDKKQQEISANFTPALLFKQIATEIKDRHFVVPLGRRAIVKRQRTESKIRRRRDTPLSQVIIDAMFGRRTTTKTTTPSTTISTPSTKTSTPNKPQQSSIYNDPKFFPGRSGIVHLFEWKYLDIAEECEKYLGPNGFAGVQISPATENIILPGRPWYERYQPISYEIKTRSGDSSDFLEMTSRCNNAGVRVYVDVVPNHMAANFAGTAFGTAGTYANPNIFYYPGVPFDKDDFNQPPCTMENFSDPVEARNCELVGLHDLNQSRENVRWSIILLLNRLIALGATGFRVDASKHMWPEDLKYIYDNVNNLPTNFGYPENTRPFIYQEVGDNWKFNYTHLGAVTEFVHPINMADVFKYKKSITLLDNYGGSNSGMLPSEYSLTFVDNHDLQRQNPYVITYKNAKEFKAAYVFTLGYPYGIPRVMSSFEFDSDQQGPPSDSDEDIISPQFNEETGECINGWVCEHRWNAIRNMIEFRNLVGNEPIRRWKSDGQSVLGFCRGNKGFILLNNGIRDFRGQINTCLPKGTYCDVITGKLENGKCTGKKVQIDGSGKGVVQLLRSDSEAAFVIHVNAKEN